MRRDSGYILGGCWSLFQIRFEKEKHEWKRKGKETETEKNGEILISSL